MEQLHASLAGLLRWALQLSELPAALLTAAPEAAGRLQAVVGEFSAFAAASATGLTLEAHEACRASLQKGFLGSIFAHAQAWARLAAAADPPDPGLCAACVALVQAVLSWDWRCARALRRVVGIGRGLLHLLKAHKHRRGRMQHAPAWRDQMVICMVQAG